jgi:hypothetical protein
MRALVLLVVVACASRSPLDQVRFANQDPVWRVDDRRDVPVPPKATKFNRYSYHFNSYYQHVKKALSLRGTQRARGVNALDEVPDSTWFTNRIGAREVSPDEIRRGPGPSTPEAHLPWTIVKAKVGGTQVGFIVEDSRGVKFLLKFDTAALPELETGADAIVARLLWAAGYNVPADHIVYFRREDLKIKPGVKGLDATKVDKALARVAIEHGKIRGIASVFITGELLGGTPRLGTRKDDPNDRIRHELRRDQRGQAALFAWLAHTDTKEDNTLDAWQADPADPTIHYVKHYLLDFGNALGADVLLSNHLYLGHHYEIDPAMALMQIASFGLIARPWEKRTISPLRGVGFYAIDDYDPATWKPSTPAQLPVIWADHYDKFWGSKILIRFTRDQIAAAVEAARFTDPRATEFMTNMLIARQRKTARHWFAQVNPVDDFTFKDGALCFTDLAIKHGLTLRPTTFVVTAFDSERNPLGVRSAVSPDRAGRACLEPKLSARPDRYTILQIESSRGMPGTLVYLATASGTPRVIGLHRL